MLVRRGVFVRRVEGGVSVADPVVGYVQQPGEVQQIDHPAGGDTCTSVALPDEPAAHLAWAGPLRVSAAADLAHRRLLARAASGAAPPDLVDLAADLIGALLPPSRASPGRAVDEVRAALNENPSARLGELAELAGWSPWHLSRTFRRVTGITLNSYRLRLRVRAALDGLAEPGAGLAALAARAGFADQAHLTRAVRRELGSTPARIRRSLLGPRPDDEVV